MNVNLGIWGALTKLVILLLFIAGILGVSVWYLPLIRQNERMLQQKFRLEDQIRKEEEIQKQLRAAVDSSRNDPKTVERLARENLGFAKPGELVIRFEPPHRAER